MGPEGKKQDEAAGRSQTVRQTQQEHWSNPQELRANWPLRVVLSWAYVVLKEESLDVGSLGKGQDLRCS